MSIVTEIVKFQIYIEVHKEKEVISFLLLRQYDRCGDHFELKLMCRGSIFSSSMGETPCKYFKIRSPLALSWLLLK